MLGAGAIGASLGALLFEAGAQCVLVARGDALETASLHGTVIEAARAQGIATPVNEGLVRIAEQATREGWKPGSVAPATLRAWLSASDR